MHLVAVGGSGVDISDNTPKPVTEELVQPVDVVVTLGREAHVVEVPGTRFEKAHSALTCHHLASAAVAGWSRVRAALTVARAAAPTPIRVAEAGPHQSP